MKDPSPITETSTGAEFPEASLALSAEALSPQHRRWLEPVTGWRRLVRASLFAANRLAMRLFFRMRVSGREYVPTAGPCILVPNHASSLDPFALAAALDRRRLARTWWAGWRRAVLRNPIRAFANRLAQTVPIERDASSLAVGAAILRRGDLLVWFAEGHRSPDGRLQPFKRGVGVLMQQLNVPVVPVSIQGTHEAMPPEARLPRRFPRITVTFGRPQTVADLGGGDDLDRLAAALRDRVADLGAVSPGM